MSEKLNRNKHFLKLLITTNQTQAKALLSTVTKDQLECLVEIGYNLVDRPEFQTLHHRPRRLIQYLGNLSISLKRKKHILIQHRGILIKTLKQFSHIFD